RDAPVVLHPGGSLFPLIGEPESPGPLKERFRDRRQRREVPRVRVVDVREQRHEIRRNISVRGINRGVAVVAEEYVLWIVQVLSARLQGVTPALAERIGEVVAHRIDILTDPLRREGVRLADEQAAL